MKTVEKDTLLNRSLVSLTDKIEAERCARWLADKITYEQFRGIHLISFMTQEFNAGLGYSNYGLRIGEII